MCQVCLPISYSQVELCVFKFIKLGCADKTCFCRPGHTLCVYLKHVTQVNAKDIIIILLWTVKNSSGLSILSPSKFRAIQKSRAIFRYLVMPWYYVSPGNNHTRKIMVFQHYRDNNIIMVLTDILPDFVYVYIYIHKWCCITQL